MRAYQGADRLIEAFEACRDSGLRLRMIGFTAEESAMRERADRLGIETHGMIPHDDLATHMRDASATVIVAHPDAVRHKNGAAPTKWPECLALGRPILSGDAYDTAQLIRDLGVGWVVPNSAEGLANGMRQLASTSYEELSEIGVRARAEAERNYGWPTIGAKFVNAIRASSKR
jgi:glycosyltransferase involved in cell wall biosynthesis